MTIISAGGGMSAIDGQGLTGFVLGALITLVFLVIPVGIKGLVELYKKLKS